MANLYLTHKCNRGCPFCFARKVLKESGGDADEILTVEDVEKFLEHFGGQVNVLGLLGGEPFLYPHLAQLLALLERKRVYAKIFTSATNEMPAVLRDMDADVAAKRMRFIVNVGTRDTYSDEKYDRLDCFLRKFGALSSLSFTIFDLQADASYLFDLIDRYDLNRDIRVGIALPIYKGGNRYIPLSGYHRAGEYFVAQAEAAARRGITFSMDCGFMACMFTTLQIGILERVGTGLHFLCGAAMDIGPGLKAWNCFPLFRSGRIDVMQYASLAEVEQALAALNRELLGDGCGVFDECAGCEMMRRSLCQGGCKSFKSLQ